MPTLTHCISEAFGLMAVRYRSRVNMVDAELSTELNEDRIAPNITAAKKPSSGFGRMVSRSRGYARSWLSMPAPNIRNAMMPGTTVNRGEKHLRKPVQSAPFCASAQFFAPNVR